MIGPAPDLSADVLDEVDDRHDLPSRLRRTRQGLTFQNVDFHDEAERRSGAKWEPSWKVSTSALLCYSSSHISHKQNMFFFSDERSKARRRMYAEEKKAGGERPRKGKREKNAETLRRKILDTSRALIADIGYEKATITRIRQAANVSIATFYKYFDSKQAILIALLRNEHELISEAVNAAIGASVANPTDYLMSIILASLDPPEEPEFRAMWREIVAASVLITAHEPAAEDMRADRALYCTKMRDALQKLHGTGHLRSDAPIEHIVDIIYFVCSMEFQEYVCGTYKDRGAMIAHLRTLIEVLIRPWLNGDAT
ncbi:MULTISPECIES: TetR/AcrR family transcriptional regulator [Phyllobacteriaceae]|jgi:AcrR family transcriptional regulator|nr:MULTISPECIES: TetR/AcrR family transcriptional regulator [Mesorhizobium]MBN9235885.1 TetR/AcrR family transcriptional regulator [Mesorhizobium sp.]